MDKTDRDRSCVNKIRQGFYEILILLIHSKNFCLLWYIKNMFSLF